MTKVNSCKDFSPHVFAAREKHGVVHPRIGFRSSAQVVHRLPVFVCAAQIEVYDVNRRAGAGAGQCNDLSDQPRLQQNKKNRRPGGRLT